MYTLSVMTGCIWVAAEPTMKQIWYNFFIGWPIVYQGIFFYKWSCLKCNISLAEDVYQVIQMRRLLLSITISDRHLQNDGSHNCNSVKHWNSTLLLNSLLIQSCIQRNGWLHLNRALQVLYAITATGLCYFVFEVGDRPSPNLKSWREINYIQKIWQVNICHNCTFK